MTSAEPSSASREVFEASRNRVVVKVGIIGDSQTGKTTLMVKYIEDRYDEDYIETLGVNFMEKTIKLRNVDVTISVWDLGGQREFLQLMPLVCTDAKVLLFVFDLTRRASLVSIKNWYKEARKENRYFIPFLIGTKFDLFDQQTPNHKADITRQARKFSRKMKAPLIYCSSSHSINVKKIFKIIVAKVFNLRPRVPERHDEATEPIIEYNVEEAEAATGDTGGGHGEEPADAAAPAGGDAPRKKKKKRRHRERPPADAAPES